RAPQRSTLIGCTSSRGVANARITRRRWSHPRRSNEFANAWPLLDTPDNAQQVVEATVGVIVFPAIRRSLSRAGRSATRNSGGCHWCLERTRRSVIHLSLGFCIVCGRLNQAATAKIRLRARFG